MSKKAETAKSLWQRYALTGAALGLYFGLFFRPVREPSLVVVFGLAALIALVMGVLRMVRKDRPPIGVLLRDMGKNFVKSVVLLAVFEGRHLAHDWGGRLGATLLTTVAGALFGLWMAYEQLRSKESSQ